MIDLGVPFLARTDVKWLSDLPPKPDNSQIYTQPQIADQYRSQLILLMQHLPLQVSARTFRSGKTRPMQQQFHAAVQKLHTAMSRRAQERGPAEE